MMKTIVATVFLFFIAAGPCLGQADDCSNNFTPCEAYANADAVFVAKVTRTRQPTLTIWMRQKDYDQIADLTVEKIFKGIKQNRLVLHQLGSKNAPKFILNSTYLFYANFDRVTKKWEVKFCGRTRMAKYATDDMHYLAGRSSSANKTRIAGEVTRYDTDEENPQGITQRLRGIRIKITGTGKEYEVTTDSDGFYELYGVPAGRYVVQPVIPNGLVLMAVLHYGPLDFSKIRSFTIDLKESACSGADIILTTDRTIPKPRTGRLNAAPERRFKSQHFGTANRSRCTGLEVFSRVLEYYYDHRSELRRRRAA
jgi:hypothetical protein